MRPPTAKPAPVRVVCDFSHGFCQGRPGVCRDVLSALGGVSATGDRRSSQEDLPREWQPPMAAVRRPEPGVAPTPVADQEPTSMRHDNGTTPHGTLGSGAKSAAGHASRNGRKRAVATANGDLASDHIDERKLLEVLTALRKGNFTPRLPVKWTG